MAEVVTRSYTCDRCGAALGSEPSLGSRIVTLSARASYLHGPATGVEWEHLCAPCGTDVVAFIGLKLGQQEAGGVSKA